MEVNASWGILLALSLSTFQNGIDQTRSNNDNILEVDYPVTVEENNGKGKCKFKHFTLEKRRILLEHINEGDNQATIAEILGVSPTSVSRELKRNRIYKFRHGERNRCTKVQACNIMRLCTVGGGKCRTFCKRCYYGKNCNEICPEYTERTCNRLNHFPYVCDGCRYVKGCILNHYRYIPDEADRQARMALVQTRRGINMTEESFAELDKIISSGTSKGQSVEHIAQANHLPVTARTVRNYISKGLTTVSSSDTPRGASFKPRKVNISKEQQRQSRFAKEGRGYVDFLKYANENIGMMYVQMDTVEGSKKPGDSARLLTFSNPSMRLFLSFPIPNGKMESVTGIVNQLYKELGPQDYSLLFKTILTDNGVEFFDPWSIELVPGSDQIRSHVFYCHPYSSWEKGAIENNHEFLRRIVPKGTSLAFITPEDCHSINSNINSYIREENGSVSPYDAFVGIYGNRGKRILKKLHISRIPPDQVIMTPDLLHRSRQES